MTVEVDTCSLKQEGKSSELKLHRRPGSQDFLVIFYWIDICLVCWFLLLLLGWLGFFVCFPVGLGVLLLLFGWFCFVFKCKFLISYLNSA